MCSHKFFHKNEQWFQIFIQRHVFWIGRKHRQRTHKYPIYQEIYPFSKIVGNANILIMPALHSAAISTKLMKVFGGGKLIGPLLIGLGLPIEVAPLRASTSEILNLASIAAYSADVIDYSI